MLDHPISITPRISAKFSNASLLAAILVVILHAGNGWPCGSISWYLKSLLDVFCKCGVPFFFIASGFFLAGHIHEKDFLRRAVGKRVRTIVIPFVLWSLLWFIPYALQLFLYAKYKQTAFCIADVFSPRELFRLFGLNLYTYPTYAALWYLRALMILVVLSPWVYRLLKVTKGWILLPIFCSYWLLSPDSTVNGTWKMPFRCTFSLEGLFFFSIGILARHFDFQSFRKKRSLLFLFFLGVVLRVADIYYAKGHEGLFLNVMPLEIVLCVPYLFSIVPEHRIFPSLDGLSFAIYLVHSFFYVFLSVPYVLRLVCGRESTQYDVWLRMIPTLICTVLLTKFLRVQMPKVSAFLFGGR